MRSLLGPPLVAVLFVFALLISPAVAGRVTTSDSTAIDSAETQPWGSDNSGGIGTADQYDVVLPPNAAFEANGLRLAARPFLDPSAYYLDAEVTDRSVFPTLPAPGALILAALGLLCLGWFRRRQTTSHGVE